MPTRRVNIKIDGDASDYLSTLAKVAAATEAADKKVDAAAQRLNNTRRSEANAAEQVRQAELRLQAARAPGVSGSRGAAKASRDLARARATLADKTYDVEAAQRALNEAQQERADLPQRLAREEAARAAAEAKRVQDEAAAEQKRLERAESAAQKRAQAESRAFNREFKAGAGRGGDEAGFESAARFSTAFKREFRQRKVFIASVVGGALTAGAPLAIAGAAALFGGIAAVAGAQSDQVKAAWLDLGDEIARGAEQDARVIIPELTDAAHDLGRAFEDIRPQIRRSFEATAPLVQYFTDGLVGLVDNSLPGLTKALERGQPAMRGFQTFLEDVGTGLSGLFDELSKNSDAAGTAFENWGAIIEELLPLIGELLSQGSELARFVLPPIAAGLSLVNDVAHLLGPVLPLIVTSFIAMKAAGALGGPLGRVASGLQQVAQQAGFVEYALGDSLAGRSAGRVNRAVSGISKGLNTLKNNLPAVGVAIVGVGAIFEQASSQANEWATDLAAGGRAAEIAQGQMSNFGRASAEVNSGFGGILANFGGAATTIGTTAYALDQASDAAKENKQKLSDLDKASIDVRDSTFGLEEAIGKYGVTSDQAAVAAGVLARKQKELDEKNAELVVSGAIASGAIQLIGDTAGMTAIQIADAIQKNEEWRKQISGLAQDFVQPLNAYTDLLDQKNEAEQERAQASADASASETDSWETFFQTQEVSVDEYIQQLEKQVQAQADWEQNMLLLSGRVSQGTLDELARLGPEGAPLVQELVDASDEKLSQLDDLFGQKAQDATDAFADTLSRAAPVLRTLGDKLGQGVVDAVTSKLRNGTATIEQIVIEYGISLASGINPLLHSLGQPEVTTNRALIQQQNRNNQVGIGTGGRAAGGMVHGPGTPTSDSILARLSDGEFVVRASATRKHRPLLEAINSERFATGGYVSAASVPKPPSFSNYGPPFSTSAGGITQRAYDSTVKWLTDTLMAQAVATVSGVAASAKGNVALGKALAAARGWTGANWTALLNLWTSESGWRNTAQNPTSTAYGIAQFLDSTWASTGYSKTSDPRIQILAGLNYIGGKYGSPANAWSFWQAHHWYGNGGPINEPVLGVGMRSGQRYGFGERGPEYVVPAGREFGGISRNGGMTVNVSLTGAQISGRLELGADGFIHLVDGRIDQAFGSAADEIHYAGV